MLPSDFRFLVVDDHFIARQMISTSLKELGFASVDSAVDGVDALKKIMAAKETAPYHVVFLDWSMPNMDGYEALKECRRDPSLTNTAIVMLTAESERDSIIKALEAGATAYIVKPVTHDMLVKKLEDLSEWNNKLQQAAPL
jgi:two-component system, chemotaxis family, chemotaxis protein CheY